MFFDIFEQILWCATSVVLPTRNMETSAVVLSDTLGMRQSRLASSSPVTTSVSKMRAHVVKWLPMPMLEVIMVLLKKNDLSRQLTTVTSILWNLLNCMCWFWRKYGSNNVVLLHKKLSNHCFSRDKCWIEPNSSVKFSLFFPKESWVFCLRPGFYQTHLSVADITLLNSQVHYYIVIKELNILFIEQRK